MSNNTVVFSSLPFPFWVLKQLPGCVMHSSKPELWTAERTDDEWDVFFYIWFASVFAGVIQPRPEVGKSYQRLRGNLLFVNGVSLNIDRVPGTHVKLSRTRPWKVCRRHGSCCMPFPGVGGNRKYGVIAKQHAVTMLFVLCSWYKNNIIPNSCQCQLTRPLLCEK